MALSSRSQSLASFPEALDMCEDLEPRRRNQELDEVLDPFEPLIPPLLFRALTSLSECADPALLARLLDVENESQALDRILPLSRDGSLFFRTDEHTSLPELRKYLRSENLRSTMSCIRRWKSDTYSALLWLADVVSEKIRKFMLPSQVVLSWHMYSGLLEGNRSAKLLGEDLDISLTAQGVQKVSQVN